MRVALFFLAALAWGQNQPEPPKVEDRCADLRAENERLVKLLNWYRQQFFAIQAQQIEQQVAPKVEPPRRGGKTDKQ